MDEVTWQDYGQDLEANLRDLHARVHRGAYRAKPSRRVYIPKADGRLRPLGVAALEDKIVQRAVVEVLNAIYEADFLGFSYGFRPGRGPHDALDALVVGIERKKVNWVLDADFRDFFTSLDHSWLVRFLEHRIADTRLLRLIQKWLKAGVVEDGAWSASEEGIAARSDGDCSHAIANFEFERSVRAAGWEESAVTCSTQEADGASSCSCRRVRRSGEPRGGCCWRSGSPAAASRVLQAEHGLSERQARRYVHAAQAAPDGVAVPERTVVFTVRLPPSLVARPASLARGRAA